MKTINVLDWIFAIIAGVGILVFWWTGTHEAMEVAKWAFVAAGISAWMSILMKCIGYFYQKSNPF